MRILAIESSCDETAAAVVEDGETVLSSVVASQMETHGKYGGVVPELASRDHIRRLVPLTRRVLGEAGRTLAELGAVGYVTKPFDPVGLPDVLRLVHERIARGEREQLRDEVVEEP